MAFEIPPLHKFDAVPLQLPSIGTWPKSIHLFDKRSAQAIRAALASNRPLLVRGDPGTGKSQLARAAAQVLDREFLSHVITAHTEIQDLWYEFDAVGRLSKAQIANTLKDVDKELDPKRFLAPGILWWAFDSKGAEDHEKKYLNNSANQHVDSQKGVVLLLDEIDKADADLPNSLLETLDNGKFSIPWVEEVVGDKSGETVRPLVLLTTNEDRQLPAAFVRRCLVLDMSLPEGDTPLTKYLKELAKYHFPKDDLADYQTECRFSEDILAMVAKQTLADRHQAKQLGVMPPGVAEFLDLLRALDELAKDDEAQQKALLKEIAPFALQKYPGMQERSIDPSERPTLEEDEA